MGKKKTADMSAEAVEVKSKKAKSAEAAKESVKKMKKVAKTAKATDTVAANSENIAPTDATVPEVQADTQADTAKTDTKEKKKVEKKRVPRSKKYTTARAFVDKTSKYPIDEAIALVRKTHYAKFPGTVEVHLVLRDEGATADVSFPYSTGRTVTVAVATDELLADIEKGNISFNVLVAHPSFMPKLAKLARVLGPKGLMPNPKNGTVSPDPEKRKKELEGGATTVKGEKKAPLAHVVIGKLTQPDNELAGNLQALLKAFPTGKVLKCSISSSMGPGIKVVVE